jgi:hypothetical protein
MNAKEIVLKQEKKNEETELKQYISNFKPDLRCPKKEDVKILMPIGVGLEYCEVEQLKAVN